MPMKTEHTAHPSVNLTLPWESPIKPPADEPLRWRLAIEAARMAESYLRSRECHYGDHEAFTKALKLAYGRLQESYQLMADDGYEETRRSAIGEDGNALLELLKCLPKAKRGRVIRPWLIDGKSSMPSEILPPLYPKKDQARIIQFLNTIRNELARNFESNDSFDEQRTKRKALLDALLKKGGRLHETHVFLVKGKTAPAEKPESFEELMIRAKQPLWKKPFADQTKAEAKFIRKYPGSAINALLRKWTKTPPRVSAKITEKDTHEVDEVIDALLNQRPVPITDWDPNTDLVALCRHHAISKHVSLNRKDTLSIE